MYKKKTVEITIKLSVLSKSLLPEAYQELMTSPDSPIIDYYPEDFETDLNGKRQEWEAVVLIPFIQEVSDNSCPFLLYLIN